MAYMQATTVAVGPAALPSLCAQRRQVVVVIVSVRHSADDGPVTGSKKLR